MNDRFNPVPIPTTARATEKYAVGLLGDLLAPLSNKLIYKVDSALDGAKSNEIDKILGNRFRVKNISQERQELTYSVVGTPVIGPVRFLKAVYQDYKPDGDVTLVYMENDYELPWTTLCTFSRSKIEAITDLRGQKGSVKELFGFSDWRIEMRGFIINQNADNYESDLFPLRELGGLLAYANLPDRIAVSGEMFTRLQIRQIYIKDCSVQEVEGKPSVLAFRIDALSDRQQELNIKP